MISASRNLIAQKDTIITYYDAKDKPCHPLMGVKYAIQIREADHWLRYMVDVWDNKVQYSAYYSDSACTLYDGPYTSFYISHQINTQGVYHDNKKVGIWRSWSEDNRLIDSAFYLNGLIRGISLSWNNDGIVTDSMVFQDDGNGTDKGFWPNGIISNTGSFKKGKKDGHWIYYHQNGNKSQEVNYEADSAVSYTCYDEQGNLQTKDCVYEKEASFKGGDKVWKEWLIKNLSSVQLPDAYYNGLIYGTVYVQFVINEDGNVTDVKVVKSVARQLDVIAQFIIIKSPPWEPAIQYNRKVKAYRRQPITFAQFQSE